MRRHLPSGWRNRGSGPGAARGHTGYLGSEDDSIYVGLAKQHATQFVGYGRLEVETSIKLCWLTAN